MLIVVSHGWPAGGWQVIAKFVEITRCQNRDSVSNACAHRDNVPKKFSTAHRFHHAPQNCPRPSFCASFVKADCYQGRLPIVECPNTYFGKPQCKDGEFVAYIYDDGLNDGIPWSVAKVPCEAKTFMYEPEVGRCADGTDSTNWERCTDLNIPVPGKDRVGYFGRCDMFGCNCGWKCRAGPPKPELVCPYLALLKETAWEGK